MYTIYSKPNCPFCDKAKMLLELKGEAFETLTLGEDYEREYLVEHVFTNYGVMPRSMPQIVNGDTYIGGYTELKELLG